MDCSRFSYQTAFKRINTVAHGIRSLCKVEGDIHPVHPSPVQNNSFAPQILSLPIPRVPSILKSTEYSSQAASAVSDAFIKSAHQIREMYLTKHRNMATLFPSGTPLTQLEHSNTFFQRQYADQIASLERLAVDRIQQLPRPKEVAPPRGKPVFNQEFVPFLETYFEYNAYPSAPDRAALAKKSMMSVRQIEVWFQNHRNRAKKENKHLRRLTVDALPHKLSLDILEQKMPFFVIPEGERKDLFQAKGLDQCLDKENLEQNVDDISLATFSDFRPPHAFPTPFPSNYEPFPAMSGKYLFPTPIWMRKPATSHPAERAIDFEDLIHDFAAKLVITGSPSNQQRRQTPPHPSWPLPWFTATHATVSPAPHPALVRSTIAVISARSSKLPTVAALSPRLHPFRSPSPQSEPVTQVQLAHTTPSPTRKFSRLPRRTPKNTPLAYRGTSPAMSEASSRSLSPNSRVSSFSSDGSSFHRTSSSSSTSSRASSTLTTPIFSPASLPENASSPISISGIDFQNMDGLFGNSSNAMSPLDGFDLNFPSHTSFNVPTILGKDVFQYGFETHTARLR